MNQSNSLLSIPQLPVLDQLTSIATNLNGWDRVAFVCVQHILPTTVSLFNSLIRLGAKSDSIYLLGKSYSTHFQSKQSLSKLGIKVHSNSQQTKLGCFSETLSYDILKQWDFVSRDLKKDINAIIVVDAGGLSLANVPPRLVDKYLIVGIEQTMAGLLNPKVLDLRFPLIDVGSSAAKKMLEPHIISKAIIKKSKQVFGTTHEGSSCGVVGFGAIGRSVAKELFSLGHSVTIYDPQYDKNKIESEGYHWSKDIDNILLSTDYIFGCSGSDIMRELDIDRLVTFNKCMISCSSADKEFLSLLKLIQYSNSADSYIRSPLDDITFETKNGSNIMICRGGFPINFDSLAEIEPSHSIQLTRGLLFGAIMQALFIISQSKKNYRVKMALNAVLQQFVAEKWALYQANGSFPEELLRYFTDINWINNHSGGEQTFQSFGRFFPLSNF